MNLYVCGWLSRQQTPQQRLVEACKRVPQGVICLFSALWFHGLIAEEPEAIWVTIDKKARTAGRSTPDQICSIVWRRVDSGCCDPGTNR
jgi:predicted transcriptional regulator of viral defense system